MFDKLLEEGKLKYVFTDKRQQLLCSTRGVIIFSIFKAISALFNNLLPRKLLPAIGVATTSTLVSHGISIKR